MSIVCTLYLPSQLETSTREAVRTFTHKQRIGPWCRTTEVWDTRNHSTFYKNNIMC